MSSNNKNCKVSVVFPIYGTFDIDRATLSVESALSQKQVNLEVVVSEQGEYKRLPKINGIKHIFNYYKPHENLSDFNPGKIRNIGVLNTSGDIIYTNDADILFLDEHYLSNAVEILSKIKGKTLFRPLMRRMHLEDFREFSNIVFEVGIDSAINQLNLNQDYIATIGSSSEVMRIFQKDSTYKKTFTAFEDDFQEFMAGDNRGREPMFWNENRHCGGNMFRRTQFMNVGGYCERFVNWGCEDSDLQWKFSEKYGIEFFPDELEVVHLDHSKGYFSSKMWARNEKIGAERKLKGIDLAISIDRKNIELYEPLYIGGKNG